MSKRRYAAVNCKQVDWSSMAGEIAGQRAVFAMDVAKVTELIAKLHWEGCSERWEILPDARRDLPAQVRRLSQAKAQVGRNRLEALLAHERHDRLAENLEGAKAGSRRD